MPLQTATALEAWLLPEDRVGVLPSPHASSSWLLSETDGQALLEAALAMPSDEDRQALLQAASLEDRLPPSGTSAGTAQVGSRDLLR
jgi:hypothetical protein